MPILLILALEKNEIGEQRAVKAERVGQILLELAEHFGVS
jgi:hypothetical protein